MKKFFFRSIAVLLLGFYLLGGGFGTLRNVASHIGEHVFNGALKAVKLINSATASEPGSVTIIDLSGNQNIVPLGNLVQIEKDRMLIRSAPELGRRVLVRSGRREKSLPPGSVFFVDASDQHGVPATAPN